MSLGQNNSNDIFPVEADDDQTLISRSRQGDMDAFGRLIEKYQDRLFNAVFRIAANRDDAMELTQEAFVRALKGLQKFKAQATFYTWLFRIGVNLAINHRRRHREILSSSFGGDSRLGQQADPLAAMVETDAPSPLDEVQLQEEHQRVLDVLKTLQPNARALVVLRDIEGLNYNQISEILDLPTGTVKSRLSRARKAIREELLLKQER